MQIISTNIGKPTPINWNGQQTTTGIFKYPVSQSLLLEGESVAGDTISDRKVHGGVFKACYLFSADHYPYWKEKYPELDWNWGMFGENLTIEGLDETKIRIGSIYKLGSALIQITQPREPCFKLGIKFGTQEILKQFIDHGFPGTYVKVLEVGEVKNGDTLELVKESESTLTIQQFYKLLFSRTKDVELLKLAINNDALPLKKREKLKRHI
ncbi:MOSC domain-containing protein [Flagellimonas aquimarina]|uniref:MOSC domain-containing protein n=1 Tax=Flagellimonas aquimarina TaxID=2201895 RepID=A0A316KSP0_9FLAO|nr:MOSC domain-containing protein [Allomuricauda koreensis]PWL37307.1 MOSC domain-containing protein [Allomuricauda koreensis]